MTRSSAPLNLARRLERLEDEAKRRRRAPAADVHERALAVAARALFDGLETVFPDDPWEAGLPRRSSGTKIDDAAQRLLAGQLTADEREAIAAAVPAEVLAVFGLTLDEALLIAGGQRGAIEWEGRTPRFVASAAPTAATPTSEAETRTPQDATT